jgi:hypothetical protein
VREKEEKNENFPRSSRQFFKDLMFSCFHKALIISFPAPSFYTDDTLCHRFTFYFRTNTFGDVPPHPALYPHPYSPLSSPNKS